MFSRGFACPTEMRQGEPLLMNDHYRPEGYNMMSGTNVVKRRTRRICLARVSSPKFDSRVMCPAEASSV